MDMSKITKIAGLLVLFVCGVFLFSCLYRIKRNKGKSGLLARLSLPVFFLLSVVHLDITARIQTASVSAWYLCWRHCIDVKK